MSSNDRPTEKKLAQAFFTELIRDPAAQPDPALPPETARLIRELVYAEQAASLPDAASFAAARQRIRRNVRPPTRAGAAQPEGERGYPARPGAFTGEPLAGEPARSPAWPRFLALAGMAATIVLVAGLLVLSLVAVRAPGSTPTAGLNPASRPTVPATLAPTPTTQPAVKNAPPTLSQQDANLLNPKRFIPQALADVARSFSLDPAALDKQLQGGMSLAEIAKTQNIPLEKVRSVMLDSFTAQIAGEKNSGQLTQAQADELDKLSGDFIDQFLAAQSGPPVEKVTPAFTKKG